MGVAKSGSGRRRSDDRDLATLSWLLIVAAVAGLAALAVVLVTASVEDTAKRASSPNPRVTTAINAAFAVETDAKASPAGDFGVWADWERHFSQKCDVIAVLYADAEVEVVHNNFTRADRRHDLRRSRGRLRRSGRRAAAQPQQGPGAVPGGLSHCWLGPPLALRRRMIPEPEGLPRMQHSHMILKATPPIPGRHLSR